MSIITGTRNYTHMRESFVSLHLDTVDYHSAINHRNITSKVKATTKLGPWGEKLSRITQDHKACEMYYMFPGKLSDQKQVLELILEIEEELDDHLKTR